jgi:hypothetical protein
MSDYLFVVPGYSDEDFSFLPLVNLLISEGLYEKEKIRSIEYASLDDQVDFRDFADKFDDTFNEFSKENPGVRIDILAHSTGSLVVRSWLYLRRVRQKMKKQAIDLPVDHLFLFAPANFGSDLAKTGRSALNAVRVTFTKLSKKAFNLAGNEDLFETGKKVLEGLEPASPIQWDLSVGDLHDETYFGEHDPTGQFCFPFVFAAGRAGKSLQSLIVKELQKDGTDSTVRIAGTSLNTRMCTLRYGSKYEFEWDDELIVGTNNRRKYGKIAFAIFGRYDHCGIINDNGEIKKPSNIDAAKSWNQSLPSNWEPLDLLKKAKQVSTPNDYESVVKEFSIKTESYIDPKKIKPEEGIFQQFFFKVTDSVGQRVNDFFIQFFVYNNDNDVPASKPNDNDIAASKTNHNNELTEDFRRLFNDKTSFHTHSVDSAHSVLMLDITQVENFVQTRLINGNLIAIRVIAKSPYNGVAFNDSEYIVFKKGSPIENPENSNSFFSPFTTTLINIILKRKEDAKVLSQGDFSPGS